MSTFRFYPFPVGEDRIRMAVEPVGEEIPRGGDGALEIYQTDLEEVTLKVTAVVPAEMIGEVVPPEEIGKKPTEVNLVCRSVESRRRLAWPLPGDGVHENQIKFRRKEWAGEAEIQAFLFRTKGNQQQAAGFASDRGAALAWSRPVKIFFDEPPPHAGKQLQIRWESFGQSNNQWRKTHSDQLFALDSNGEYPILYLNKDFSGASRILDSNAPHGEVARLRDATYMLIVHQVWSSLIGTALTAAAPQNTEENEMTAEEKLTEIGGWKAGVLRDWSKYVFPSLEAPEALEHMVNAGGDPIKSLDVMDRLGNAIQSRLSSHQYLQKLWEG